jgi:histidinol-phosphate/aromatic aminotransferase/cobyric acid decarboxylase-like protein
MASIGVPGGAAAAGAQAAEEQSDVGKSLKEVLEEREVEIKEMEQLEGKYSLFIFIFDTNILLLLFRNQADIVHGAVG